MTKTESILDVCSQAGLTQWLRGILSIITRTSSTFFLPFFRIASLIFCLSHLCCFFPVQLFCTISSATQLIPFPKDFHVFDDIKNKYMRIWKSRPATVSAKWRPKGHHEYPSIFILANLRISFKTCKQYLELNMYLLEVFCSQLLFCRAPLHPPQKQERRGT